MGSAGYDITVSQDSAILILDDEIQSPRHRDCGVAMLPSWAGWSTGSLSSGQWAVGLNLGLGIGISEGAVDCGRSA